MCLLLGRFDEITPITACAGLGAHSSSRREQREHQREEASAEAGASGKGVPDDDMYLSYRRARSGTYHDVIKGQLNMSKGGG